MTKKNISILILKNVEKLGQKGTISSVPLGFARNFLIPQGLACVVTEGIKKRVDQKLEKQKSKDIEAMKAAKSIAKIIEEINTFTIKKKVGKDNLIFGSITNQEVADFIGNKIQQNIDKKNITVPIIKKTGLYAVDIKIHHQVEAKIHLQIISEDD
nr:ribosomal protein L9 [Porphyropsis coccinea]